MKRARGRASSPAGSKRATVTFADLEARSKKNSVTKPTWSREELRIIAGTLPTTNSQNWNPTDAVKRIQTIRRGNFKVIGPQDLTPLGIFINRSMKLYMRKFVPPDFHSPNEEELNRIFDVIQRVPQRHTKWKEEHIRMLVAALAGVACFPGCALTLDFIPE
ncbi:hypothetical protein PAPYR_5898 [Paratrimastix pyriformis]|uniref:Uncharacterized protein n=1 Tax=Paratrimastix pyriformis TaxID=342808 RepID=A0ABQ8UGH1_9EUKA|nr:hypothetical protein PAPYR_5898 [Paratrimastix pyriformis]